MTANWLAVATHRTARLIPATSTETTKVVKNNNELIDSSLNTYSDLNYF